MRGSIEDGFYVENLYSTYIETVEELLTILEEGELNRAMASHNLNDTSSRSHAMLSIQIEQDLPGEDDPKEQMTRQGKLVFVDLAGKSLSLSLRPLDITGDSMLRQRKSESQSIERQTARRNQQHQQKSTCTW